METENKMKITSKLLLVIVCVTMVLIGSACDEELPAAGSLPDETPPTALFSFTQGENNYLDVRFTNESNSATTYEWDFGDGETSTEKEPANVYDADGTYTVSLTASDNLGATNTYSAEITLVEPDEPFAPTILESGFEDGALDGGSGDGRDSWKNSDLGGVIQITASPVYEGAQSAKLPTSNDRIGYQLVSVESDTDYVLSFYYTMKTTPVGTLRVAVLAGEVNDPSAIDAAIIASGTYSDQTDDSAYLRETINFNSGENTQIAIYFDNVDVEVRLDAFSIVEN